MVNKAVDREWRATDYPGIERSLFRNNETGGRSSVVRLARGSRFPRHTHQGSEEVVVLYREYWRSRTECRRLPLYEPW
ncbi:MAG: cupin domain-containing protein [Burkholderiales bacterium]